VSNSGRVVVVDVQADRIIADLQTKGSIDGISVSRDGRRVAAVNTDLHVIDTATGRAQSLPNGGGPLAVALRPDGAHIVVGLSEEIRVPDGGTLEQPLSVRTIRQRRGHPLQS
jgi:DNA-binding beta-propeller fold protein YncE